MSLELPKQKCWYCKAVKYKPMKGLPDWFQCKCGATTANSQLPTHRRRSKNHAIS